MTKGRLTMHDQPLPLWPPCPCYPLPLLLQQRQHLLRSLGLSTVGQVSRHRFVVLSDFIDLKTFVIGNDSGIACEVKGVGDIDVNVCNRAGLHVTITFKEVLYVPNLKERSKGSYLRLLSVKRAT